MFDAIPSTPYKWHFLAYCLTFIGCGATITGVGPLLPYFAERYEREAQYSQDLMTQLDAKRAELSGVSLDEELANLIKFQHAYNAAAKVITTVDEMLDKIINGMI